MAEDLKWLADTLGAARDADVYAEQYSRDCAKLPPEDVCALHAFECHLSAERLAARTRVKEALQSDRYCHFIERFAELCKAPDEASSTADLASVAELGATYLSSAKKRVLKRGRRIDRRSAPGELHRLRKEVKRFRYLLEALEPYQAGPALTRATDKSVRLQDVLGKYQDACAGDARVRTYRDSLPTTASSPHEWFVLGQLAEQQRRRAAKARKRFDNAWKEFHAAVSRM